VDEIYLSRNRTKVLRLAIRDAIDEGTVDALGEQIMDAFTDEQVEAVEAHLDGQSLEDVIEEALEEWTGEDEYEFLNILETRFGESGIDLKLWSIDDDDLESEGSFGTTTYDEEDEETEDTVPLDEDEEYFPPDEDPDDKD